jgi:hypothetical protein
VHGQPGGSQGALSAIPRAQLQEVVLCSLVATVASCLVVLVVPSGGDLAAHLYRTSLVREGVYVWDNLWFAGQYPLSSYSLLYYPLAAILGNAALGVAGVVLAAAIFASVAQREWRAFGRWPARAFAVLLAGQAFTAAYPYDLGLAMLLATLWALQRGHVAPAAVCTVLTLGISPLAFLFLALTLFALFLRGRRLNRRLVLLAAAAALAAGVQLALLVVLPTSGLYYPYGTWRLLAGLAVAGPGIALALRGRAGWTLASVFCVWAAASIAFALVPSPVGHNLARASVFAFPLVLVAAALAGFRPRWLAASALAAALASNVLPYTVMISDRSAGSQAAFWRPVLAFLQTHETHAFRVEVVPTAAHWEAYYLPRADLALARGWYRQLDIADNHALYAPKLTAALYRGWLRQRGVRYVVLPHLPLEAIDAQREADLLTSGSSGLREAWATREATIYALPDPTPILTGPGSARITTLTSSRIDGRLTRAGSYLLRVHYSAYLSVSRGSLCLTATRSGMTRLVALRPGPFAIQAIESPTGVLATLLDNDSPTCPGVP